MIKNILPALLLIVATGFTGTAQSRYNYSVDLTRLSNDQLKVSLLAPKIKQQQIVFYMPKIVPGTYTNSDFGKFVHDVKAFDKAGKALPVTATADSNGWRINKANRLYKLEYHVEDTWDASFKHNVYEMAGTNFEANKNFCINTCGVFGYFEGMKKLPFELHFTKPEGFYGSSGLVPESSSATNDVFYCENVDRLYDSPIMFCMPDTTVIKVGTTDVLISVYSPKKLIHSKTVAENMKNLLTAAKNYLGGKLPVNKYAFLYYFNSEQPTVKGQGAWEHSYSSFYSLPELPEEEYIGQIVDISSHEFFHIVTPLNICSKEVREFNFNSTILSKHLWLYEGSTEYDAHHAQVTQGLISVKEYLGRLSKNLMISKKYYDDTLPFTELSLGSAGKYARQYGNVYQKGALINACLDIYLEKLTEGNYGLHDLKHDLSLKYGPQNYFNDNDLFDEIARMTLPEVRAFFASYVEGSEALPYEKFFDMVGVNYLPKKETTGYSFGNISTRTGEDGQVIVTGVAKMNAFGKAMGYKTGDIILGVNGTAVTAENFSGIAGQFVANAREGDTLSVKVKRNNAELTLSAPAVKVTTTKEYVLELNENAGEEQVKIRNAWLKITCK